MALVELTRTDGSTVWVNPRQVLYLWATSSTDAATAIFFPWDGDVGQGVTVVNDLEVEGAPGDVARVLNGEDVPLTRKDRIQIMAAIILCGDYAGGDTSVFDPWSALAKALDIEQAWVANPTSRGPKPSPTPVPTGSDSVAGRMAWEESNDAEQD